MGWLISKRDKFKKINQRVPPPPLNKSNQFVLRSNIEQKHSNSKMLVSTKTGFWTLFEINC